LALNNPFSYFIIPKVEDNLLLLANIGDKTSFFLKSNCWICWKGDELVPNIIEFVFFGINFVIFLLFKQKSKTSDCLGRIIIEELLLLSECGLLTSDGL
jgi:hypothetical protein